MAGVAVRTSQAAIWTREALSLLGVEESSHSTVSCSVSSVILVGKTFSSIQSIATHALTDSKVILRMRTMSATITEMFKWDALTDALRADD